MDDSLARRLDDIAERMQPESNIDAADIRAAAQIVSRYQAVVGAIGDPDRSGGLRWIGRFMESYSTTAPETLHGIIAAIGPTSAEGTPCRNVAQGFPNKRCGDTVGWGDERVFCAAHWAGLVGGG